MNLCKKAISFPEIAFLFFGWIASSGLVEMVLAFIVAIKFLPRQIAASDEERERFKIEAQAAQYRVRLKRSAAWWYVAKANDILALRCAKYNGTFDRLFQKKPSKLSVKNP